MTLSYTRGRLPAADSRDERSRIRRLDFHGPFRILARHVPDIAPPDPPVNRATHSFDGGLTVLVSPNLQLDASGGVGLVDAALDYFAGVGVSWRLPR